MRNFICGILTFVVAGFAMPSTGQVRRVTTPTTNRVTTKLPYTAEYKISSVQTLANGSTITHDDTEERAVDAQGRVMTQSTITRGSKNQTPLTHVSVIDPVAKTLTSWTSRDKKAIVIPMGMTAADHDCGTYHEHSSRSPVSASKGTTEQLGTETIAGVEARGTRTTFTTPAGEVGNDVPLVKTFESWRAINPGLSHLLAREINDDPRNGKTTKELTSFTQGDPDASLFAPPADYEIVMKQAGSGCPTDAATDSIQQSESGRL
jgi:hypothetical protein